MLRSKDSFKNYVSKCYQTGLWLESGKVFKRLQKYIIRIADNQGQFLKKSKCYQNDLLLESSNQEKCSKVCRRVSFENLRSKNSFKNYIIKCYHNGRQLESNQEKWLHVCRSISFEVIRSKDSFQNYVSKYYQNGM